MLVFLVGLQISALGMIPPSLLSTGKTSRILIQNFLQLLQSEIARQADAPFVMFLTQGTADG
jgi:hypothetical protein